MRFGVVFRLFYEPYLCFNQSIIYCLPIEVAFRFRAFSIKVLSEDTDDRALKCLFFVIPWTITLAICMLRSFRGILSCNENCLLIENVFHQSSYSILDQCFLAQKKRLLNKILRSWFEETSLPKCKKNQSTTVASWC